MSTGPGRPLKLDRDFLHQYIWNTRLPGNYMAFTQGELAEELGVTQATMSATFKDLADQGRVKKFGSKVKVFDPDVTKWTVQNDETLF